MWLDDGQGSPPKADCGDANGNPLFLAGEEGVEGEANLANSSQRIYGCAREAHYATTRNGGEDPYGRG